MASNRNRTGQAFLVALISIFVLGYIAKINRNFWEYIVTLTIGWIVAEMYFGIFEVRTKGNLRVRGKELPIQWMTIAYVMYFVGILVASFSALVMSSLLIQVLELMMDYSLVVSAVASLLVFLRLRQKAD